MSTQKLTTLCDSSDADPEILTEYCFAILQSDATDEEIKKSAIENLEDFLKEREYLARLSSKRIE
jgi:hypothetical protein